MTGGLIFSCPYCGTDLDDGGWCASCEASITDAVLTEEDSRDG